jgi:hypothetical protein
MAKQPQHPDRAFLIACQALMAQEPLPPYELDRLFADLRVRRLVGELIVRAAGGPAV